MSITKIPPAGLEDVVAAGSAGSASQIPVLSINSKGQVVSLGGAALDLSTKMDKDGSVNPVIRNTAPTISLNDTDQGVTKKIHHNSDLVGFLGNSDQWLQYVNNSGQINTPAYGWLHDFFFSSVANCAPIYNYSGDTGNCSANCNCITRAQNCGNVTKTVSQLVDNGSEIQLRAYEYNHNCNCNCQCNC